jgi:hypothetical protein
MKKDGILREKKEEEKRNVENQIVALVMTNGGSVHHKGFLKSVNSGKLSKLFDSKEKRGFGTMNFMWNTGGLFLTNNHFSP